VVRGCIAFWLAFTPCFPFPQRIPTTPQMSQPVLLIPPIQSTEPESLLTPVLKIRPTDPNPLTLLATVRAKQGKLNDAELFFTKAVKADARLVGAHMNLAYLYLLKNAPDKTAEELKAVLRLDPKNSAANFRLAWVLFSQGHLDECIEVI